MALEYEESQIFTVGKNHYLQLALGGYRKCYPKGSLTPKLTPTGIPAVLFGYNRATLWENIWKNQVVVNGSSRPSGVPVAYDC